MDVARYWCRLGAVDVAPLVEWIADGRCGWPPVKGGQPNRVRSPEAAMPVIAAVLDWFGPGHTYSRYPACLSRLVPGATYEFHRDPQPPSWVTRVHVPVLTNPGAWLEFEGEGHPVHFAAGFAYSFNTLEPHRYGNGGNEDRIHLLFDVLRE